ncbi:MAG: Molybdopterin converting factor, subunit 1 [Acetothermia bacterium 64_32]|nr:MAG: Molybdopterin converting factor, subunit 1 [Acetothermia bacterium 64_32]MBC7099728.1 MoaD/ThiS family protein [Candidatus Bipolaricaulota bacterium]HAF70488.1 molybdopterin converting factor subunit 1 [Candidatus Acetothermia bacterium]
MKVKVLLFADLREVAGQGELALELPEGSTVGGMLRAIEGIYPALAGRLPQVKVAVGRRLAGPEAVIRPGEEVALLPPVGGG